MKIFAFIMSCVIFIASIVPCKDVAAGNEKQTLVIVKAATNHECNGASDICSPLCICNCCAGCSMYYSSPQLPKFTSQISSQYTAFIAENSRKIILPVWQPPKID